MRRRADVVDRAVHGGLVFVNTCRSHPEQYDVLDETGREVGFVHYRRGWLTVTGPWDTRIDGAEELLYEQRPGSTSEWPGDLIDGEVFDVWMAHAAALIHHHMRAAARRGYGRRPMPPVVSREQIARA